MRKILPYLMQGFDYSQACSLAGYNHSDSLDKR
jgi:CRISPR-associated endonuclease Csn1